MTDNSKYTKGYDFYDGNTVTDWARLDAAFVYLRAGIGTVVDSKFGLFAAQTAARGLARGPYLELWPGVGATAHGRTLTSAHALELTTLPVALAFEKEPILGRDKKNHKAYIPTWPSFGDALTLYNALEGLGRQVMIYTNLDGLETIKASALHGAMGALKWWIGRYNEHPGLDGEMSVDATLALLESAYGIPARNVLFMQTCDGGIPYPAGFSPDKDADIDRVVSYAFPPAPVPPPTSTPAGALVVDHISGGSEEVGYMIPAPIFQITDKATGIVFSRPASSPPPVPTPTPGPSLNLYRVKWMFQRTGLHSTPSDPFNKPDVLAGELGSVVPLVEALQWYWFGLLRMYAPGSFTEEDLKRAWKSLTRSNAAYTNDKGSDICADFINRANLDREPITVGKYRANGGAEVNVLDDKHPVMVRGEACYKVEALNPLSADLSPDKYNYVKTPWLVQLAVIDYTPAHVGPFPQLGGNNVPVPCFGVGGYNLLPVAALEKITGTDPGPYLPPRSA